VLDSLRTLIADYGYWAVALALLCENAGLPVPGETTLLLASFLAYSEHKLHLGWIIVVGPAPPRSATTLGMPSATTGTATFRALSAYLPGFEEHARRGERLFCTLRFLHCFLLPASFSASESSRAASGCSAHAVENIRSVQFARGGYLGDTIALVGYFFGKHWDKMEHVMGRLNLLVGVGRAPHPDPLEEVPLVRPTKIVKT